MKRILFKLFLIVLFLLFLGFAIKNMDTIVVRYFLGFEWRAPLAIVLAVVLGIGTALGAMVSLAVIARQKREILSLKRDLRRRARTAAPPVTATAESL